MQAAADAALWHRRHTKKLCVRAVEGRLVGSSSKSKSYRIYSPVTRQIVESSNVVFIETPSQLLPPSIEESSVQVSGKEGVNNDNNSHNYATDDFVRDLCNYISMTHLTPGPSADHVTTSKRTENPQVTELLGRISEVTWRDTLQEGTSRSAQKESFSEGAPHLLPSASSDETSAGALQDDSTDSPKNTTARWIIASPTAWARASRSGAFGHVFGCCSASCRQT